MSQSPRAVFFCYSQTLVKRSVSQCTAVTARLNNRFSALPSDSREIDTSREMSNKAVHTRLLVTVICHFFIVLTDVAIESDFLLLLGRDVLLGPHLFPTAGLPESTLCFPTSWKPLGDGRSLSFLSICGNVWQDLGLQKLLSLESKLYRNFDLERQDFSSHFYLLISKKSWCIRWELTSIGLWWWPSGNYLLHLVILVGKVRWSVFNGTCCAASCISLTGKWKQSPQIGKHKVLID